MLVAKECHKIENVDLNMLLSAEEKCYEILQELINLESSPIRMAALIQLSSILKHHKQIFKLTQDQLEGGSMQASKLANSGNASLSISDEQSKRCALAVEGTIVHERKLSFSAVAGLTKAKQALREAVVLPLKYPHLFTGSCCPWSRILLYGPPGTGKTRLAEAVSGEIAATFYCVSSSDLISSWVGESEKIIKELFTHARKKEKAVIFIDEIDSVCRVRHLEEEEHTRRVKTELLKQMEGIIFGGSKDISLLCATNCPWELDPAFLRRFQRRIYVPLPNSDARREILEQQLDSVNFSEEDWTSILSTTEGYSGSDLAICVTDALLQPIRELEQATHWRVVEGSGDSISYTPCAEEEEAAKHCSLDDLPSHQVQQRRLRVEDLVAAVGRCGQTVQKADLEKYTKFTDCFGQAGQ